MHLIFKGFVFYKPPLKTTVLEYVIIYGVEPFKPPDINFRVATIGTLSHINTNYMNDYIGGLVVY